MSENGLTARGDGVFEISGSLTFQTVPRFQDQAGNLLQGDAKPVTIDMKGVTQSDSAGLALMIEWLQMARTAQRELVFAHIPEQIRDLIRVNGLQQMFSLENEQNHK
ncbi:MAG: STAS domain-containing protein [Gammaproteobacteria bacterium]|nr:STAS domain-containing protein [Gammaproteobacteria bacterium]MDH3369866.1 STAS domain-containing protein [Gammaproteobacteria bacterium]MDH3405523.1 STAS domain-containing protein [Gammaproteobacteria bacterium]MDH3562027.1 STAS domain-containing protein [Gammaproteobacteria bacterium]MDH5486885.1 STAS domain-containing protein [Gammaproteobacteria bacterium]